MVNRLLAAFSTIPTTEAWVHAIALAIGLALIALPLGFWTGFLQLKATDLSWPKIVQAIAMSFVTPALAEELVFRALVLPHPTEQASLTTQWLWGSISLGLFIIYHPLNALTFFRQGLKTFTLPIFLLLAGLLGGVCTLTYLDSGCLWLPVLIHWVAVILWLLCLGGYQRLYA